MKKKKLNLKLDLSKKIVSNLNAIKGGYFSEGCTDGCSPFPTVTNCTNGNCTGDCASHWGCE